MKTLTAIIVALLIVASSTHAQDFHFISDRDSSANEVNYEIYHYMNGSETRVTTSPVIENGPVAQFDPIHIMATAPGALTGHVLVLVNTITGQVNPFGNLPPDGRSFSYPFISQDGQSVYVTCEMGDGRSVIRQMNRQGQDLGVVVDHGLAHVGHSPCVTVDGNDILYYTSNRDGDFEIFNLDLGTGVEKKMTDNKRFDSVPVPSPDGKKVAFSSVDAKDGSRSHIVIMNSDGSDRRLVTSRETCGIKYPFSWDGDDILYVTTENGDADIAKINSCDFSKQFLVEFGYSCVTTFDSLTVPNLETKLDVQPRFTLQLVSSDFCPTFDSLPLSGSMKLYAENTTTTSTSGCVTYNFQNPGIQYCVTEFPWPKNPSVKIQQDFILDVMQPQFPGTNDNCFQLVGINSIPDYRPFWEVKTGDYVHIEFDCQDPTFINDPWALSLYDFGLFPNQILPGLWIDPQNSLFILGTLNPLGPVLPLGPRGNGILVPLPPTPALVGKDLMLQSVIVSPNAANGNYAASNGTILMFR